MNAPHKPLVVIAATTGNDKVTVAKAMTDLARQWRDAKEQASVVFTWMDAEKWGTWLKSMYGLKAGSLPRAIVADHSVSDDSEQVGKSKLLTATWGGALQRLVYYDTDPFGESVKMTAASLFPTINGAAKGTLAYKHSENMVERLARVRCPSRPLCSACLTRVCVWSAVSEQQARCVGRLCCRKPMAYGFLCCYCAWCTCPWS